MSKVIFILIVVENWLDEKYMKCSCDDRISCQVLDTIVVKHKRATRVQLLIIFNDRLLQIFNYLSHASVLW